MFTVDLHSHILPEMDDGASNVNISLSLLREEMKQGINQVVFTPHYYPLNESVEEFVGRREIAWNILQDAISGTDLQNNIEFYKGAEIRFSPALVEFDDLKSLCISGTNVLLIEFTPNHFPEFAEEILYRLQVRGFQILLAHVERFPWLRKDPEFLYRLVCSGVYAQFNADSVISDSEKSSFIHHMLKYGLLHGIGSDTHNLDIRPPYINEAGNYLSKKEGTDVVDYLNQFSIDLLAGKHPVMLPPTMPKKSFWDFFRK